jgi:signal transduction histidine kinase
MLETQKEEIEIAYRDLRETQVQLVQSEKMASLGQLVAGVAHELNNPINFVYANIHYLRKFLNELRGLFQKGVENASAGAIFGWLEELLEGCRHGAERTKQIVTDLRTFSRLDEAEFKQADIHEGIESTLTLLDYHLKDRITVHRNYGKIPPIECYPGQLNQVFMNLLANAAEAIQDKGDIWIRTAMEGDEVVISIRDNGIGIPEEHLEKLFTPFFTTKEVGRGIGLGLSVTYGIIQKHGGQISVESEVDKGSTFTIRLPVRRIPAISSS